MPDSPTPRLIAFMPWLRIVNPITVGSVTFIPFKSTAGTVEPRMADLQDSLKAILSGYVDAKGTPIDNCVVATVASRSPVWNLDHGQDGEKVRNASLLLSLAIIARNDYNTMIGCYGNTASTLTFWQQFTEPVDFISLTIRRRDGHVLGGGYRHGEIKFQVPLQCQFFEKACLDEPFLVGLGSAVAAGSAFSQRLLPALSFFDLANTDDGTMLPESEVVLIGSAFEQLLETNSAYTLCTELGPHFAPFGSISVENALSVRPGIVFEDPKTESDQRQWFVHKKWIQELYVLRSKIIHGKDLTLRNWGWNQLEHLTMAAFVFPLLVKALLAAEGHYTLTENDEIRCRSVDHLLVKVNWASSHRSSHHTVWQNTISEIRREIGLQRAIDAALTELHQEQQHAEESK